LTSTGTNTVLTNTISNGSKNPGGWEKKDEWYVGRVLLEVGCRGFVLLVQGIKHTSYLDPQYRRSGSDQGRSVQDERCVDIMYPM